MTVLLALSGVTVRFGAVKALNEVDLEVAGGTIHAVIGPNGAGKSSLFNVVSGLYRPECGQVWLNGTDIVGLRPHEIARAGIARAFQNTVLSPHLTVEECIAQATPASSSYGVVAAALSLPRMRAAERSARHAAREAAEVLGVADYLPMPLGSLPYGVQKRVDLARAVAMRPTVLLLDEPVAGMNGAERGQLGDVIAGLRDEYGLTVVIVEHDVGLLMRLADRVTVLDFGQRIAEGTPSEVQANPAVVEAYLGSDGAVTVGWDGR